MLERWQRRLAVRQLKDPAYRRLFEETTDEVVSLACDTTSLDVAEAELLTIGVVRLRGNRIVTSEALHLLVKPSRPLARDNVGMHGLRPRDLSAGLDAEDAVRRLLDFIGGRPVLGYYLEFDVAVLDNYLRPLLGIGLPNRQIEISGRYYDYKLRQQPDGRIDLRLAALTDDLGVPALPRHDALNKAITAAMLYLALKRRGFG
ncbi:MAG TPA: 3'-5' exonuclease [Pseudogulbenkiania sp.]|nr:3'-5' exonuclease [Pseudogulbenkiania sp.]